MRTLNTDIPDKFAWADPTDVEWHDDEAQDMARDSRLAFDKAFEDLLFPAFIAARDIVLALDKASVRYFSEDGHMHVKSSNISKATVNPYWSEEIPDSDKLGLKPKTKYWLLRHPDELAKAASTFDGLPILAEHVPVTATDHRPDLVIGSTGTDAKYKHPFLTNSLHFWDQAAIDVINSGEQRQLSCAYHYVPVMTPGTYEGRPYDGIMTQIKGNHVACVEDGRAGKDVVVADAGFASREWAVLEQALRGWK